MDHQEENLICMHQFFQFWNSNMKLKETAKLTVQYYQDLAISSSNNQQQPYVSVIVNTTSEDGLLTWLSSWERAKMVTVVQPSSVELFIVGLKPTSSQIKQILFKNQFYI
jgi:hypothetical protein